MGARDLAATVREGFAPLPNDALTGRLSNAVHALADLLKQAEDAQHTQHLKGSCVPQWDYDRMEARAVRAEEALRQTERAFAQACTNLAVLRPDGRDMSIGEIADLYRDALLAGWGGIQGWPLAAAGADRETDG